MQGQQGLNIRSTGDCTWVQQGLHTGSQGIAHRVNSDFIQARQGTMPATLVAWSFCKQQSRVTSAEVSDAACADLHGAFASNNPM